MKNLSTYTLQRNLLGATVLALATAACGGDDSSMSPDASMPGSDAAMSDATEGGPVRLEGAIQKGPFGIGSNVSVALIDPLTTDPTGMLFPTSTRNDLGEFDLTLPGPGAAEIQTTGFYFNEIVGQVSVAQLTMRALAEFTASGSQQVYVNALTHLAHLRAKKLIRDGMGFAAAIDQAEAEVRAALPLAAHPAIGAGTALNLLGGDNDDNAYLFALSCILAQAAFNEAAGSVDAALQELMNTIALDLEGDGALEASNADTLLHGARFFVPQHCIANMEAFLAAKGSNATVPTIYRALDFDRDGTGDLTDDDADGDGVLKADDGMVAAASAQGRGPTIAVDGGGFVWMWSDRGPDGGRSGCVASGCPALPVPDLAQVTQAAVGGREQSSRVAVLHANGTVSSWSDISSTPQVVSGLDNVVWIGGTMLYGGRSESDIIHAVRSDGTVWRIQSAPVEQVTAITGARAFFGVNNLGQFYYWALRTDGTVDAYSSDFSESYHIDGVTGAIEISIGSVDAFAVDGNGQLWKWSAERAILDQGTTAVQVPLRAAVVSLQTDGVPYVALADGSVWHVASTPTQVTGIDNVKRLGLGYAILNDGNMVTFAPSTGTTVDPTPLYVPR